MDELHEKHVEIDERWLSEWFEFGFAELSSYLAKHAAFDDFLRKHEIDELDVIESRLPGGRQALSEERARAQ